MQTSPISVESIREHLSKILSSSLFANADRSRALLQFVVEQAISGQTDRLKEYTLGAEALGRGDSFDPRTDPIVRAEASRLRNRLERYYSGEGHADPVEIALPKGSYVPQFLARSFAENIATNTAPKNANQEHSRSRPWIWIAAGALVVATIAGAGIWVSRRSVSPRESPLVQFDVELKAKGALGSEVGTDAVISPDGTRLAYISLGSDGVTHLNTRRLDQSQAIELPETEGARGPFFSPEGQWVGFSSPGKLKKTSVDGGSPTVLCESADSSGVSWGQDGYIITAQGTTLSRIPASGGQPTVITDLASESASPRWPQVLPGAKLVIFTSIGLGGPDRGTIEALSLSTGKRSVLARGGTFGRYLPNGFVTYVNQGTLFAIPFDIDRMEARGAATPILNDVSYSSTFGFAQMDFSQTGALVYRKSNRGEMIAEWLDAAGKSEPLLTKPGRYLWPSLSPDGGRLAFSVTESGTPSVWIYEHKLDQTTHLTPAGGPYFPAWSPDGNFLVLGGPGGLSWLRPYSSERPTPLTHTNGVQVPWSFSSDGKRLAFHEFNPKTGFDLWTVPIEISKAGLTAGKPEPYLQSPALETYPSFSPDGRWMAYGSNESGSWEVYVRAFPDNGTKVQVSTGGGRIPRWSRNGHELFYRTDDQRMMVAAYSNKDGRFTVHSVRPWSQRPLADTGVLANFDLSPDGRRILALMPAVRPEDQQTVNHVTFVQNFFDEVRRKVASAGR